ncbi:hypothetical protein NDO74_20125 [Haloferax sp. S2CR25-2]|nr:hypothetical protein [Haloferax sp. S2CR25]MDS0446733.1 hypothetical protein [Haloferax sp. S2CR25-2]
MEFVTPRGARGAVVGPHSTTMSSDYEQQRSRLHSEHTEQPSEEPWAGLELALPHGRSPTGIVSFVERVLVELTHEDVGAEFVSTNLAGVKRTQFIAVDDVGQRFQKRYFDERLGWHETTVSRGAVRDELVSRLSRLSLDRIDETPNAEPDTFRVMPTHQL